MHNKHLALLCIAAVTFLISCGRKTVPETSGSPSVIYNGKTVVNTPSPANTESTKTEVKKTAVRRSIPAAMPKAIMVNDKVAKKNIDGRLYYDVEGHRYWRNYNDGKYYLFNKKMYGDSAFIPH